ncbi:MAG: hypothetical protein NTW25_06175, partial [Candidatus Kapabacteria bacterium]|nr:hypothetical protein [Candidatus Kapabacteria bacterium]
YKLEYGPIYHIDPNCNILSAENLGNPDFWAAIDQQVIRKAELLHPFAIDCNDLVNGGIETDFEISRRPCQKIVFDMFSQETTLESCNDSENKCVITYSVCKHTVNSVVVYTAIKKSSYQFGFPQCSTTISTTMHQTNILNIYESDCFSVGCN